MGEKGIFFNLKDLKPGEIKFFEKFEQIHKEKPKTIEEAKEKVTLTIEKVKEEIESFPEFKEEQKIHHGSISEQTVNILAQAIQIAINESVEKALEFIKKTNNPYLLDAFHDLLVGHFISLIVKNE